MSNFALSTLTVCGLKRKKWFYKKMAQILQLKCWFWSSYVGCTCQKRQDVCNSDSVFHVFIFFRRVYACPLTYRHPPLFLFSFNQFDHFFLTPFLLHCRLLSTLSIQTMENQMKMWCKEVGLLQVQVATIPQQTQLNETVTERQTAVAARMVRLIEPLKERRRILLASKELHQVRRDLEDEIVSLTIGSWNMHTCTGRSSPSLALYTSFYCGFSCGFRSASPWPWHRSLDPLSRRFSSSWRKIR